MAFQPSAFNEAPEQRRSSRIRRASNAIYAFFVSAKGLSPLEESAWQRGKREASELANGRAIQFTLVSAPLFAIGGLLFALPHWWWLWRVIVLALVGLAVAVTAILVISAFYAALAPYRQRDEARAKVKELTAVAPFPDVLIEIEYFRQDFQNPAGNRVHDGSTHRVWFPVVVTNREESRRVSLRFDVTINSPDGHGLLFPRLLTEQQDSLPLVVDAQDSERLQLSVFLNEYVTQRVRNERMVGRLAQYSVNGDLFRLNVFDLLSQKRIEMRLPSIYPEEKPPGPPVAA